MGGWSWWGGVASAGDHTPRATEAAQTAVSGAALPLQQTLPLEQTLRLCPPRATAVHWIRGDHSREKESSCYFGLCLSGATDTFPGSTSDVSEHTIPTYFSTPFIWDEVWKEVSTLKGNRICSSPTHKDYTLVTGKETLPPRRAGRVMEKKGS